MFLLEDGVVVHSASDLTVAATCEYAALRMLDKALGRAPLDLPVDAMLERAARLGDAHEARILAELVDRFGPWDPARGTGVALIERPGRDTYALRATLEAKHAETLDVLRTGADVVFQGGFFDGRFGGWADFLVREPGGWAVHDAKLARHAKVTALLQVAAYADQLLAAGLPVTRHVHLVLGDRSRTTHRLADLLPVYRERRRRLEALLDAHAHGTDQPVRWGDGGHRACLRCAVCAPEVAARRDVLTVARLRVGQREHLRAAGVVTIDQLAARADDVPGLSASTFASLRAQARLQLAQERVGAGVGDGPDDGLGAGDGPDAGLGAGGEPDARLGSGAEQNAEQNADAGPAGVSGVSGGVVYRVVAPEAIHRLPPPDAGDIFFDFEGDPLWAEQLPAQEPWWDAAPAGTALEPGDAAGPSGTVDWGLEYLFGVVEHAPDGGTRFQPFWAHDRVAERQALLDFLDHVEAARARHPGMHVYHYAAYERTALLRLAGRHGVGEERVDRLLRDGVLVDLYATVRAALRVGQDSYSLKKIEPLYSEAARHGEVTTAGDSVVEYALACAARDEGRTDEWHERLDAIGSYNEADCVSTLRLRDWLLAHAGGASGPSAGTAPEADDVAGGHPTGSPDEDPLVARLREEADAHPERPRTPDEQALAMLAAALGYHWREAKPYWWAHFDRLSSAPDDWTERRSTLLVEDGAVVAPWALTTPRARTPRRRLRLVGRLEPGADLRPGAPVTLVYDPPLPDGVRTSATGSRGWTDKGLVLDVTSDGMRDVVLVEEGLRTDCAAHDALPMALTPSPGPKTDSIVAAIRSLAEEVAAGLAPSGSASASADPSDTSPLAAPASRPTAARPSAAHLPDGPATDLLRRRPPRTRGGAALPPDGPDAVTTLTDAVALLDSSYLAVQGPPGTGKTHTGARVIARLVERGWRIGVVAQSHAVVENLLAEVVAAGVDPARVAKRPADGATSVCRGRGGTVPPWVQPGTPGEFARFHAATDDGAVVGGTTWDHTNRDRLPARPYDLMVVDEAGQYSLADTVAVSRAARSLLLLGDPQQLPQVSQGRHPEPVDRSALGWLSDGHDTLPPELGYFLDRTWRMHPALCGPVSRLAYEDRLRAVPEAAARSLDGVAPGVRRVLVDHHGNAVASPEEAAEVVRQVRDVVGARWRDPARGVDRPLTADDVLVVAAYNAQVATVRRALDDAGFGAARVGTVDRFQGQEAVVVLVTLAASDAGEVPRGVGFLLDRHRLNVAVSRGRWAAVLVHGAGLLDHLPTTPDALADLGGFLGLTDPPDGPKGAPDNPSPAAVDARSEAR